MRKDQIIKIAMVVCIVAVLCAVIVAVTGVFSGTIGGYANAEKYTAGEMEIQDEVKNLDINWINGKVNVVYANRSGIRVTETSKSSISDDLKLRWWMDGNTLRIQYSKPGLRLNWNFEKELTVELPESLVLETASVQLTSGDVNIPAIKADTLHLGATSGELTAAAEARIVDAGTTSGDVKLKLTGNTESVSLGGTSGNIHLEAEKAGKIKAGTTSGTVEVQADQNDETKISCTSGTVRVTLKQLKELEIGTTSGNVQAYLPEEPGFKAKVGTTSGDFTTSIAMSRDGKEYTCGDGSGRVTISTTSGDVRIEAVK